MLSGSLFTFGLFELEFPAHNAKFYLWHGMFDPFAIDRGWGFAFILTGLALLALALLRKVQNPYGYFAFGALLPLIGMAFNIFSMPCGRIYLILLPAAYLIFYLAPRRAPLSEAASPPSGS